MEQILLMQTLHSLQWQSLGFHFLSFSLNHARNSMAFIFEGINLQILGPKYKQIRSYKQTEFRSIINTVNWMCHKLRFMSQMIMGVFYWLKSFTHYIWRPAISNHMHLN